MSNSIAEFVQQQQPFFTEIACDQAVLWEKESQFAIQAFQKSDRLVQTAWSNPASAQNAIINVAAVGITLNPALKLAYLVPRDGAVHLDISYQGLIYLAQTNGAIKWCQCRLVHESDVYETNEIDKAPTHKRKPFAKDDDRGAIIGGYCTVKTAEGDYLTEEMSVSEINQIAAVSKAKNGPWKNFWSEMARKTIIKRASKYWPKSERVDRAIDILNQHEGIYTEPEMPHTPEKEVKQAADDQKALLISQANSLCEQMEKAKSMIELKTYFQDAYKLTREERDMQQTVQAVYAENKGRIEAAAANQEAGK